jgi:hypothetical protein
LIICAGSSFCPIYVLTNKSVILSVFYEKEEIDWSDIVHLELKVELDSSPASSSPRFNENDYSVSANASSRTDLELSLFSLLESKDILSRIVDTFKNKGVPIKCKIEPGLDAVLKGVDLSKLDRDAKGKFEVVSYINETCKK